MVDIIAAKLKANAVALTALVLEQHGLGMHTYDCKS